MGVIGAHDVVQQPLFEEELGRHVAPQGRTGFARLRDAQNSVLPFGVDLVETSAMPVLGLGVERADASSPGVPLRR